MGLVVTETAGFMGSDFVRTVVQRGGDDVSVPDSLTYAGNLRNPSEVWEDPTFSFIHGDICDAELVRLWLQGVDAIVQDMTGVTESIPCGPIRSWDGARLPSCTPASPRQLRGISRIRTDGLYESPGASVCESSEPSAARGQN
jgi:hypothetical protein